MLVWESIKRWAETRPEKKAVWPLTYWELKVAVERCYRSLPEMAGKRVGLYVGNRPLWGIYDIALTLKGAVVVPIPTFFSPQQIDHMIKDAGIMTIVADSMERLPDGVGDNILVIKTDRHLESGSFIDKEGPIEDLSISDAVSKIIYTSGTTGRPKGVMVTLAGYEAVTKSLFERTGAGADERHLCLLPLSTLVEAIGGLYLVLVAGGTVIFPRLPFPPENILFRPQGLRRIINEIRPTSLNLVPSLLDAMLEGAEKRDDIASSLRFVACGGAPLLPSLRERAVELGVPLYEGYGLSECSSVVALNSEGMNKRGSVGRALRHAGVKISDEGEIVVIGPGVMKGYTNGEKQGLTDLHTGDLGYIDEEGYLFITGRKDNLILTSQGRNVSPEWVESELTRCESVSQAFVYGGETGEVSALIVPSRGWMDANKGAGKSLADSMKESITISMDKLPEYARVRHITVMESPFSTANGLLGPDGRLNRKKIILEIGKDRGMD